MRKLEVCCYTVESAILAEQAGAQRIELCDNYLEGGTTPSLATIRNALEKVNIPVNVIVRPRGGDFLYSQIEYETIKEDIVKIKELGANGIVIGFLLANGEIDLKRTSEVVELAKPMEVTFHRAFDMCKAPLMALKSLKEIGVTRILTSGAKSKAIKGIGLISQFVEKAGNEIIIMPGSGINENNLEEILTKTHANEFHCSAKTFIKSNMKFINNKITMGGENGFDEYSKISVNTESIRNMIKILNVY